MIFLFNFLLLLSLRLEAASCCGGGGGASGALITGDDKALFNFSLITSDIKNRVGADGIWEKDNQSIKTQTTQFEAAHIFADRFQMGVSVKLNSQDNQNRIGDTILSAAYEALPDWSYHPWKPKGVVFLGVTVPTGASVYDEIKEGDLISGRGFWSLGVGAVFLKSFKKWDASLSLDAHQFFSRQDKSSPEIENTIHPGRGYITAANVGYNLSDWRFGVTADYNYEDPIIVNGDLNSKSSFKRFSTMTFAVNYLADSDWSYKVSASDQSLLGSPVSAELAQSFGISIQRKWSR